MNGRVKTIMKNVNTCVALSRHDLLARAAILKHYKKLGETNSAIKSIQREISKLANAHYNLDSILPDSVQIIREVEASRNHKIIRIRQHDGFYVAIHIVPSRYRIPAHLHPGLICIINVISGELHIKQRSLSNSQKTYYSRIKEQQACAGLLNLKNIHQIKTQTEPCIFLSFRITRKDSQSFKKKLFLPFASSTLLILSQVLPQAIFHHFHSAIAQEKNPALPSSSPSSHVLNNPHADIQTQNPDNPLILADKLRNGDGIKQDLYAASQLYLKEAKQGNAEAQYWLGIMILDGSGITEDYDEALHWIASSSDQEYPPAQKLLQYLLATDDTSDC